MSQTSCIYVSHTVSFYFTLYLHAKISVLLRSWLECAKAAAPEWHLN